MESKLAQFPFSNITLQFSLGNPSKDRQRFVDAIVLFCSSDWLKRLSNCENVVETPFEFGLRTSNDARFCQTELRHIVKYTESTMRCLSLLLPILGKLSKFSQNYKFREVFSKRGASFFKGGLNF